MIISNFDELKNHIDIFLADYDLDPLKDDIVHQIACEVQEFASQKNVFFGECWDKIIDQYCLHDKLQQVFDDMIKNMGDALGQDWGNA